MQNINNFQLFLATHQTLFISLIVWSLVWKGFALWKAGKNNSPVWFVVLFIVNTLGLLEIIYLFTVKNGDAKTNTSTSSAITSTIKTETKVEAVTESVKEEVPTQATVVEAETNNQETNQ